MTTVPGVTHRHPVTIGERPRYEEQDSSVPEEYIVRGQWDEARQSITDLQRSNAELRRALKRATATINVMKTEEGQISDDRILSQWRTLEYNIENWVSNNFKGADIAIQPSSILESIADMVDECEQWLMYSQTRVWLVEAYVWRRLKQCIFVQPHREPVEWIGDLSPALFRLANVLNPKGSDRSTYVKNLERFHRWRADTVNLLSKSIVTQNLQGVTRRLVDDLADALVDFATCQSDDFYEDLFDIVWNALCLSVELGKQRAVWSVVCYERKDGGNGPITVPRSEVRVIDDIDGGTDPHCTAHLAVRPALLRYGDRDGHNIHLPPTTLSKSAVIISKPIERVSSKIPPKVSDEEPEPQIDQDQRCETEDKTVNGWSAELLRYINPFQGAHVR